MACNLNRRKAYRVSGSHTQLQRVRRTISAVDQEECLNRIVPFGERHLRIALAEFKSRIITANKITKGLGMS